MARRQSLDALFDALGAVRAAPAAPASAELVRKALASPSNVVVAKAARLVQELRLGGYAAELAAAFERFVHVPQNDRGCAALTDLSRALLETKAATPEAVRAYHVGLRHRQLDGGLENGRLVDSAAALRGYSAWGLLEARHPDAVTELTDLLADPEPASRIAAARGLASAGRDGAALVLRYKLRLRDPSPDVLAECMTGLLRLEPAPSLDLVASFLGDEAPELRDAAALALGESRLPAALAPLRQAFDRESDAGSRKQIVLAAAMLRTPEAVEWLVWLVTSATVADAIAAVEALRSYRSDAALAARVRNAVAERRSEVLDQALARWSA
jgi:HEAT repeat protein